MIVALAAEAGVHHPNPEEGCMFRLAACHLEEGSSLAYRQAHLVDNFQDPSDTCQVVVFPRYSAYSGTGCNSPHSFDICVVAPATHSGPVVEASEQFLVRDRA